MRFDQWMTSTGTTNPAFAAKADVSGETVRRWRAGERFPDREAQERVYALTGGAVTPNDWVGVGPGGKAPIDMAQEGRS